MSRRRTLLHASAFAQRARSSANASARWATARGATVRVDILQSLLNPARFACRRLKSEKSARRAKRMTTENSEFSRPRPDQFQISLRSFPIFLISHLISHLISRGVSLRRSSSPLFSNFSPAISRMKELFYLFR